MKNDLMILEWAGWALVCLLAGVVGIMAWPAEKTEIAAFALCAAFGPPVMLVLGVMAAGLVEATVDGVKGVWRSTLSEPSRPPHGGFCKQRGSCRE